MKKDEKTPTAKKDKQAPEAGKDGITSVPSSVLEPFTADIAYGFLGRTGGVSNPPVDSLNFDARGGDTQEHIDENMARAFKFFGILPDNLVTLNQVHGSEVQYVDREYCACGKKDADASVSGTKGLALGILTADCMPILFYDPVKRAVGAAHAGWKSTLLGVAAKTVEAMKQKFGTKAADLVAAFGPFIGPCCYTVRKEVLDSFEYAYGPMARGFFVESKGLRLDIARANRFILQMAGLKKENIGDGATCTSCYNVFFSYRRDGRVTGRQLSFIMLRG